MDARTGGKETEAAARDDGSADAARRGPPAARVRRAPPAAATPSRHQPGGAMMKIRAKRDVERRVRDDADVVDAVAGAAAAPAFEEGGEILAIGPPARDPVRQDRLSSLEVDELDVAV